MHVMYYNIITVTLTLTLILNHTRFTLLTLTVNPNPKNCRLDVFINLKLYNNLGGWTGRDK